MGAILQDDTNRKFSFNSVMNGIDDRTFAVVEFTGYDCISKPYRFDILLVAITTAVETLDIPMMLTKSATFTIDPDENDPVAYHGILYEFEQLHSFNEFTFFRARLMPRIAWLMHSIETRSFLGGSINGLISRTLTDENGMAMFPYQTLLNGTGYEQETDIPRDQSGYPLYEYVCQYDESRLHFLSHRTEHEGVYYFFTQDSVNGETVVFTNSHLNSPGLGIISYSSTASNNANIRVFTRRYHQLPSRVELKDYVYEKAYVDANQNIKHANIEAGTSVDPNGHGKVYRYGEHLLSIKDAERLAGLRAQELLCRGIQYFGESRFPSLRSGYYYQHQDLDNPANSLPEYLITEVNHQGNQTSYLTAGVLGGVKDSEKIKKLSRTLPVEYENTFTALEKTVPFRPERQTEKPKISGTINAFVDADKGNIYADIDSMGRYKVRLPFESNAMTHYIRMIQPHAGIPLTNKKNYGAHFPLHRGTEVQLAFVNGDPDRPIITGAVPNIESPSPVVDTNLTENIIRDRAGNEIVMDSKQGEEYIRLFSPKYDSTFQIGKSGVETFSIHDFLNWTRGNKAEFATGTSLEGFVGAKGEINIGFLAELKVALDYALSLTGSHEVNFGYKWEYSRGPTRAISEDDINSISHDRNIVSATNDLCLIGGAGVVSHDDNTSIINANEAGIVISVGEKQTPFEPGSGTKAQWICLSAAIAAVLSTVFNIAASEFEGADMPVGQGFGIALSSTAALASVTLATIYALKLAKDSDKIQLVRHNDPESRIDMNKEHITLESIRLSNKNRSIVHIEEQDGVSMRCEKGQQRDMLGRMKITEQSGSIEISNFYPDSKGTVFIGSNKNIDISTKQGTVTIFSESGNLTLEAGNGNITINANNKNISLDGKTFKWKGDTIDFGSIKAKK